VSSRGDAGLKKLLHQLYSPESEAAAELLLAYKRPAIQTELPVVKSCIVGNVDNFG